MTIFLLIRLHNFAMVESLTMGEYDMEMVGVYSSNEQAYQTVLAEMEAHGKTRSWFIEEWEVDGKRVNIHRYD